MKEYKIAMKDGTFQIIKGRPVKINQISRYEFAYYKDPGLYRAQYCVFEVTSGKEVCRAPKLREARMDAGFLLTINRYRLDDLIGSGTQTTLF